MSRYKTHRIIQGETLQAIAQKETGSVANWEIIAQYNALRYPYIVSNEEKMKDYEHLATIGDQLVIPLQDTLPDVQGHSLSKKDQEFVMSLALGRDLQTNNEVSEIAKRGTSDEILGLTHSRTGDVETVYGVENVKQATINRLATPVGSLLLHPEYGSNLHNLFQKNTSDTLQLIRLEIIRTVLKDSRMTSCTVVNDSIVEDAYIGAYKATIESIDTAFSFLVNGDSTGNIILT